ncbi:MAG: MgtC/SapB family protein [Lutibacter sp.]|nr:MgtC/SapB family protein [Lutibacter sp.]MDT8416972.1 MgtC/SapB family protein [Lutibacter sp.]
MEEAFIIKTENFQLTELDFIIRMLISLGVGLVLGLEREYSHFSEKEEIFAGIRTFPFVALIGFLSALLSFVFNPWIFITALFSVVCMVVVSYWVTAKKGEIGGTTEFALIVTFLLGGLTLLGFINASLALMVIAVVLLSLKMKMKIIIGQITQNELYAFVRFVVISLLILPFLPNQYYGPYEVINPREVGWIIVLISGIGFVGYLLTKFLGTNRGIFLTSIVGGLVSSTIVTYIFSKKSKENPTLSKNYATGIFAAATIQIFRIFLLVFIFNKEMLVELTIPLLIILLTAFGVGLYFYTIQFNNQPSVNKITLGDPLNIKNAVFFGMFYIGILLLVSYANNTYGTKGIYISSAISALTDIDAITISVSKLGGESMNLIIAQNAILLATLSNTIVKIGIALWIGSRKLKKQVLIGYGCIFIAGIAAFLLLNAY